MNYTFRTALELVKNVILTTKMNKCVFLDRDGVLNREIGRHVCELDEFEILPFVPEGLLALKSAGYKLVVVTNQSGIARGYYQEDFVYECHSVLQRAAGEVIDALYFAPGLDKVSKTLSRKPDSLMFEKAMAKFKIDPQHSWMIGDKERDLIPARKLGISTIHLTGDTAWEHASEVVNDFKAAVELILEKG